MNGQDVKETMEQIHISEKMQEEIVMNVHKQMENRKKGVWNVRKMGTVAAALVLTLGVISVPVHAMVSNLVKARMESIPEEEVQEIENMIQKQNTNADGFSREYSDTEKARSKELWQAYENGTFPEREIQCVDSVNEVTEGVLCYVGATGDFYLPEGEMTDEEILEIIDFQHKMNYAVSRNWTQEKIDEADRRDRAALEEKVKAAGGISEDEAIEIARKAMEADIGEKAEELEVRIYPDLASNGWKLSLYDITDWDEYKDKGDIAYSVQFGNKAEVVDPEEFCDYHCMVNAMDGSICGAYSLSGDVGLYWDIDDIVWYEH